MVYASNAFNSVNRDAYLPDKKVLCPATAMFINDYYSTLSDLFIQSGKLITITGKNTGKSNGNSYMHFRNHTTAGMVEQIF